MAISGQQIINIGVQNESANSDSLYAAFNKTKDNFANLFSNASQYVTFTGNTGITVNANSITGSVNILNSGVTSIVAGTGVTINQATGAVTISASGNGNAGLTSVGLSAVSAARLAITNSPLVVNGVMTIDLATTGVTAGVYTYPSVTVDTYGRITSISSAAAAGTVTSVGITPGTGISVTNSPITTSGSMTVTNTGVTRINAGSGIAVSGANGNVTISTTVSGGSVTSVGVSSTTLTVASSPVVTAGVITVDLPSNTTITVGNINIPDGRANVTGNANVVGGGATVGVRSILAIDSAFGSNSSADPASAQAIRGRVTGSNLTKTRNYVAGVTGQYLITGTNASEFINTGLLGVVGDQTTTANAAVVAYLDGDGGLTTAGSAYGVSMKNSTPNSGFDYGLDLQFIDLNVVGTTTPFKQADIRFNNGVKLVANVANTISIGANLTVTGNITSTGVALLNSSQDLADAAAANLAVTSTYFSTAAAETGTLAAGSAGQIKTLMMYADLGDMVITVTNAGWKTSGTGTITFDTIGDACTLQYTNSKWFCIGNNGVTFA